MKKKNTVSTGVQPMHYSTTLLLVISSLVTFGLATLFSKSLLGEPLGYFAYLGDVGGVQRASAALKIIGEGGGGGTIPLAPSNLAVTATTNSSIQLSWRDNANNEQGFKLERMFASPTSTPADWGVVSDIRSSATTTPDNTRLVDTSDTFLNGLLRGKTYRYRVRAYNAIGFSGYSNEASGITQNPPGDTAPPSVPANVSASVHRCGQVRVQWTRSNDSQSRMFGYNAHRDGAFARFVYDPGIVTSTVFFIDTGLIPSTYSYAVTAYDDIFNVSQPSLQVSKILPC